MSAPANRSITANHRLPGLAALSPLSPPVGEPILPSVSRVCYTHTAMSRSLGAPTESLSTQPSAAPSPANESPTQRSSAPAQTLVEAPESARVCSGCGLTESEFERTGLLGCARCYERFASVIAQAVERLHGVALPKSFLEPKLTKRSITNPWPTRRGVRL